MENEIGVIFFECFMLGCFQFFTLLTRQTGLIWIYHLRSKIVERHRNASGNVLLELALKVEMALVDSMVCEDT